MMKGMKGHPGTFPPTHKWPAWENMGKLTMAGKKAKTILEAKLFYILSVVMAKIHKHPKKQPILLYVSFIH